MSHETVALLLWSMLAIAIALTIVGVGIHSSRVLFVAAALSLVFGLAAIFSIGIFILALALIQLSLGIAYRRQSSAA
ncbi:MAG TPA: hypothetical protein VFV93_15640 [Thermomicrobiales bacterium]|nr:hypothetical protein [Thermomicrobiales bacterium]